MYSMHSGMISQEALKGIMMTLLYGQKCTFLPTTPLCNRRTLPNSLPSVKRTEMCGERKEAGGGASEMKCVLKMAELPVSAELHSHVCLKRLGWGGGGGGEKKKKKRTRRRGATKSLKLHIISLELVTFMKNSENFRSCKGHHSG